VKRRFRGLLAACVLGGAGVVGLSAPTDARADVPLDLTWTAPAGCPTGDAVRAELQRVVRVRRGRTPPLLTVNARIEQSGANWILHLRTKRDGVTGERRLQGGSCASLVGAATLVMALAYGEGVEIAPEAMPPDPEDPRASNRGLSGSGRSPATRGSSGGRGTTPPVTAPPTRVEPPQVVRPEMDLRPPVLLRPPRPAQPPEPEAPEPTLAPILDAEDPQDTPREVPPDVSRREQARREEREARQKRAEADDAANLVRARRTLPSTPSEPLRWSLSASGLSGWGPLPKQAFGVGVGLDVGSENWLFNLRAQGSPKVEKPQEPGMRLEFASAGGSVSGCGRGHLGGGPLAVSSCLGVQLNVLRGEAIGASSRETALVPLFAGLASLRFEIPIAGAISLQFGGDLAVALQRPRFEVRGVGDVFQVPRVAPSVALGLAARL
jgi:hypothetical protein